MWCRCCNNAVTCYHSDYLCQDCYEVYKNEVDNKIYPPGFLANMGQMTELEWIGFRELAQKAKSEKWSHEKLQEEIRKYTEGCNETRRSSTQEAKERRRQEKQHEMAKIRGNRPY